MKKILCFVSIMGLFGAAAMLTGADESAPAKAEKAVRKVLDDQVAAWNKGDLKGFMAGYWNDEKLSFYSGKDRTYGWKNTLDRYEKKYQGDGKEMGTLEFAELELQLLGDQYAIAKAVWKLKLKKEDVSGLFTVIFRKTDAGWKVIHDHTSG